MEFKINFSGTGHRYTKEEIDVVVEAMQNADPLTQGKYRDSFEKKFCEYNGNEYAFSLNNATSALELSAQLCLFKDSDEIDEKYISYVVHAYNLKYIDGMEDGRFAPKENLTRAQAAVVMNNLK